MPSLHLSTSQPHSPHMHPPIRKMTSRFRQLCVLPGHQDCAPTTPLTGPLSLFSTSRPTTSYQFIVFFWPHHGFGKESCLLLSHLSLSQLNSSPLWSYSHLNNLHPSTHILDSNSLFTDLNPPSVRAFMDVNTSFPAF